MRDIYNKLEFELNKIDFNTLWEEFKRYDFAIYDNENVYLKDSIIEKDNRFIGNTCIKYNDEYLAIWYLESIENIDIELLASNIVHEMFHCYQLENSINVKNNCYPTELEGLNYPKSNGIFQSRYTESKLIIEILDTDDMNLAYKLFNNFINLRYKRMRNNTEILYEYLMETIEGTAEYVGLKSLKLLNNQKYIEKYNEYYDIVLDFDLYFFNIRKYAYFMGTLILLAIEKLNIIINSEINNSTIMEELFIEFKDCREIDIENNIEIEEKYNNYIENQKSAIKNAKIELKTEISGKYIISGYDPMNMIKIDNEILHNHFVMLRDLDGEIILLKEKVITVLDDKNIDNIVKYYKK